MPKPQVTVFDGMEFPDYEFRQYPMMVYKGDKAKPQTLVVHDDEEWTAAQKTGWVANPSEIGKTVAVDPAPTTPAKKLTV